MGQKQLSLTLCRELSRLSPDIFSHPVWLSFNETHQPIPENIIQEIQPVIQSLISKGDLTGAGQLLLVCSALQKQLGDYPAALSYAQQAWSLAELNQLPQIAQWAAWGVCAVSTLQGQMETAAAYLSWLRGKFGGENDWVLANLLEIIEFALTDQTQLSDDLAAAFNWLQRWGEPPKSIEASCLQKPEPTDYAGDLPTRSQVIKYSTPVCRTIWSTIKRIISGQLQLRWVDKQRMIKNHLEDEKITSRTPFVPQFVTTQGSAPIQDHQTERVSSASTQFPGTRPPPNDLTSTAGIHARSVMEESLSLSVYYLGTFRVFYQYRLVENWPNRKGQAIFKYLLMHHQSPVPKEVLMDIFWSQVDPDSVRNRLNVAMHGLRQGLRTVTDYPIILFETDRYRINPAIHVWLDVDEFERSLQAAHRFDLNGQDAAAIQELEVAASLYTGDFLSEDLYEDWPVVTRERLRIAYLDLLERLSQNYLNQHQYSACIAMCHLILARDNCSENAHRLLMQCYGRQGQYNLALRQYQVCIEALRKELDVEPEPATVKLAERIRRQELV